ncbi:MAG: rod shape-determining protein MreC [Patescibacteria group bacterium]
MIEKKKNQYLKIYILAVIILLIFFHYLRILAAPENFIMGILNESQHQTYAFLTKLKYSFINYQEAQNLKKENIELKRQYDELLFANTQLNDYKTENEKLRTTLNFKTSQNYDLVLAKVIGRDQDRLNTLLLDKGKLDGIAEGYPVVVDNGIIVGKVIAASDHLATVLLITDKMSELAVSTLANNKTTGMAIGEYGLSIKVELIPQDLEIKEGDLFITSGLEKNIPRGLILGKINRIISQENELFKSATLSPLLDYEEITILSVILPKSY